MAFIYQEALNLSKVLMTNRKRKPGAMYSLGNETVSYEALNAALNKQLNDLVGSAKGWRENKNTVFTILEETLNEVQPANLLSTYGMFADVSTVAFGDTVQFNLPMSAANRTRAKQFVTRVAEAGQYEVFELSTDKTTIKTTAYGGAARLSFNDFLTGRVQWSDYLSIIDEGMSEAVFKEIQAALAQATALFPAANRTETASFEEPEFDRLIATIAVYGSPVIYTTREGAMAMSYGLNTEHYSDAMNDELFNAGYFARYKGTPVVILPQSFVDATNSKKQINPGITWVFPSNSRKPVQIAFEGTTQVKEFENRDWSTTLNTYQKFGVAILNTNNLGIYINDSLNNFDNTSKRWDYLPGGTGYPPIHP